MPFTLQHILFSSRLDLERHDTPQGFFFTVAAQGSFLVLHPGRLKRDATASVRHSMRIDIPDTQVPQSPGGIDDPSHGGLGGHPRPPSAPRPLHNGVQVSVDPFALDLQVRDPNGQLFTRDEVTLADLKKFRTVRGASQRWSFSLGGRSRVYNPSSALNESVTDPVGSLYLVLTETVASSSAAPLVPRTQLDIAPMRATFDLLREGDFVANVVGSNFLATPWHGSLRLIDPDGAEFGRSNGQRLRLPIPLSALGRSRDGSGKPRTWTLEATPSVGGFGHGTHFVTANVLASGRINTGVLQSRIARLFGPAGTFLQFSGRDAGARAEAVLTIKDASAAETIDMHGLFDAALIANGESTDVNANTPLVLASIPIDTIGYGTTVHVGGLQTTSINLTVGPAQHLPSGTPALRLRVGITGQLTVKGLGQTLASASIRGGAFEMEVGLHIDPDGTPRLATWLPHKLFDIDFKAAAIAEWVAATTAAFALGGSLFGPLGTVIGAGVGLIGSALSVPAFEAAVEAYANDTLVNGVAKLIEDPTLAPRILMKVLGAHMTYLPIRFDGADVLFEHIAPVEPDPKPRKNYAGAIGRSLMEEAVGHTNFIPMSLGDTWAATKLKQNIDHIVVVMMENRSYDHVLGSRSLNPATSADQANGWTPELVTVVNARAEAFRPPPPTAQPTVHFDSKPPVQPMRDSAFAVNALGLRTRLPKGVGHELEDVTEQLAQKIPGPGGGLINDPGGFINNFRERKLGNNPYGEDMDTPPRGENVVVPFDVLRYYETNALVTDASLDRPGNDLPITAFLAANYSYCDKYFCSHPGPTLPNRMYSLTGDVQYDRYGFPILDNNDGDNFLLSRAQTIYDVLTREGVTWKVYESEPSVTMLRMFARYAGDNVNIRPISELEHDFVLGTGLPSFVVIEPAMHHQPEDDDHPDADMYRGQKFLRRVYEAVTANPAVWAKTMLIITYDEHGGFYDHVIPPIADVFEAPRTLSVDPGALGSAVSDHGSTPTPSGGGRPNRADIGPVRGVVVAASSESASGGRVPGLESLHISPDVLNVLLGEHLDPLPADVTVKVPYGVRVPTFVVSPWVAPGVGPGVILDHCSILKTVLARFCSEKKPFLNDRVHVSHSFESFLTESSARPPLAPPALRDLPFKSPTRFSSTSQIITAPLSRKRMREEQVDYHDISGRIARMLGR